MSLMGKFSVGRIRDSAYSCDGKQLVHGHSRDHLPARRVYVVERDRMAKKVDFWQTKPTWLLRLWMLEREPVCIMTASVRGQSLGTSGVRGVLGTGAKRRPQNCHHGSLILHYFIDKPVEKIISLNRLWPGLAQHGLVQHCPVFWTLAITTESSTC